MSKTEKTESATRNERIRKTRHITLSDEALAILAQSAHNASRFIDTLITESVAAIRPGFILLTANAAQKQTGLEGFEPSTSGLEARRYVQAKPQTRECSHTY